jgi:hypothetical protein
MSIGAGATGDGTGAIAGAATVGMGVLDDLIMFVILAGDSVAASAKSGKSEGDNVAWRAAASLVG